MIWLPGSFADWVAAVRQWRTRTTSLQDEEWERAMPVSRRLPSGLSSRVPDLMPIWSHRAVCKAWHRAVLRGMMQRKQWTHTELLHVSCSYFEGGTDFFARRLVFKPDHGALSGTVQVSWIRGSTGSHEQPEEVSHADGSFVCEIARNEKTLLNIRMLRTGEHGQQSVEDLAMPVGQALFGK
mmetsp:Transcript_35699/g.66489  ORF Transcript_35699/g.66489 Transcript_35699/m.66489 type:complete len:182 (-) Transcript_35699:91-636(-)